MKLKYLQHIVPIFLLFTHIVLHISLGISGWLQPFELFNLLLLIANGVIALLVYRGKANLLIGIGIMLIVGSHAMIGQRLAPDSLTSGAILMVNILILYVGFKIFEELTLAHAIAFVASYFLLFFIFIKMMDNAEAIFLLSLMGLAAVARNFKLLAYFWAVVIAFTFCQPYAWPAVLLSFFFLKIMFSINSGQASPTTYIFLACGLLLVFFVLLPVVVLLLGEDSRNIINMLKDAEVRSAIALTAITATISTVILLIFCVPLAYAVSRLDFYGKSLLLSLIDIPIIIPHSAAGIALLQVFGKQQYFGELLFNTFGIRFDGTILGICLAQIFVAMPFLMKSALAAFEAVPPALERSARTLGASSFGAFRRIALPLSAKGLFIGAVLAWARAAGEFGAVLFIAAYPVTAPIAVYNRFTSVGLVQAAPLVATLLLFSLVMFFLLQLSASWIITPRRHEGTKNMNGKK
jgi:molybdate/tungstate transport system permease protein